MVLSDREIVERVKRERMIEPFVDHQVSEGVVSYGLSSYGYDFRVAGEFKMIRPQRGEPIDPKALDPDAFVDLVAERYCDIPANAFVLGRSLEYFRIPRDVVTICLGKSTYARSGIVLNVTPFEPEWEGHATLAIVNTGPRPVRVYANEGIGQILFLRASVICLTSYKDRQGRYDRQQGIALSRVR